eukprot:722232-Pleurochrysis_carterae.AAC.1
MFIGLSRNPSTPLPGHDASSAHFQARAGAPFACLLTYLRFAVLQHSRLSFFARKPHTASLELHFARVSCRISRDSVCRRASTSRFTRTILRCHSSGCRASSPTTRTCRCEEREGEKGVGRRGIGGWERYWWMGAGLVDGSGIGGWERD